MKMPTPKRKANTEIAVASQASSAAEVLSPYQLQIFMIILSSKEIYANNSDNKATTYLINMSVKTLSVATKKLAEIKTLLMNVGLQYYENNFSTKNIAGIVHIIFNSKNNQFADLKEAITAVQKKAKTSKKHRAASALGSAAAGPESSILTAANVATPVPVTNTSASATTILGALITHKPPSANHSTQTATASSSAAAAAPVVASTANYAMLKDAKTNPGADQKITALASPPSENILYNSEDEYFIRCKTRDLNASDVQMYLTKIDNRFTNDVKTTAIGFSFLYDNGALEAIKLNMAKINAMVPEGMIFIFNIMDLFKDECIDIIRDLDPKKFPVLRINFAGPRELVQLMIVCEKKEIKLQTSNAVLHAKADKLCSDLKTRVGVELCGIELLDFTATLHTSVSDVPFNPPTSESLSSTPRLSY